MLGLFIILLTAIMMLNCVVLILLVLMQLPKKEAGAGLAFGGAATDALFGAGSGNFLTKATKWSAGIFFALAILMGVLQSQYYHGSSNAFRRGVEQQSKQPIQTQGPQQTGKPAVAPPVVSGTNESIGILRPVETNGPPK